MRVHFQTEGGVAYLPGLAKPVVFDSDQLSASDEVELRRLVDAANFFSLPSTIEPSKTGAADYRHYTVTIEEGQRKHTVQLTDLVENAELRELLVFLRAKAKAVRGGSGGAPPEK